MTKSEQLYFEWPAFIINDLKRCRKIKNASWEFDVKAQFENQEIIKTISFQRVYIQGYIDQKPCDNVMILRDFSGKVKLSNCTSAFAECDNLVKGAYCAVNGTLTRETGLPEISAHKIKKLENPDLTNNLLFQSCWPMEVKDFKLFVLDILKPDLEL